MKPKFALDLSHEGINLLHRRKGGWSLVGSVDLDDPEMGAHLADLRRRAAALESGGLTCKIIIPNSQVLYTTLEAPGPDDIAREVQIRSGLDGLTPYPVGELVFDWRAAGERARVAVLARDTMDEAETFAVEHRFNPVSFVARPPAGEFSGEPFFGKTRAATKILGPTERVEPDASPVPRKPATMDPYAASAPRTAPPPSAPQEPDPDPAPHAPGELAWHPPAEPAAPSAPPPLAEPKSQPTEDLKPENPAPFSRPDPGDDPFAELDAIQAELSGDLSATPAFRSRASRPQTRLSRSTAADQPVPPPLAPFPPTSDDGDALPAPPPAAGAPATGRAKAQTKPANPERRFATGDAPSDEAAPRKEEGRFPSGAPRPTDDRQRPHSTPVADDDTPAAPGVAFSTRRSGDRSTTTATPTARTAPPDTKPEAAPATPPQPMSSPADQPTARQPRKDASAADRRRAEMADALSRPLPGGTGTTGKTAKPPEKPAARGSFSDAMRGAAGGLRSFGQRRAPGTGNDGKDTSAKDPDTSMTALMRGAGAREARISPDQYADEPDLLGPDVAAKEVAESATPTEAPAPGEKPGVSQPLPSSPPEGSATAAPSPAPGPSEPTPPSPGPAKPTADPEQEGRAAPIPAEDKTLQRPRALDPLPRATPAKTEPAASEAEAFTVFGARRTEEKRSGRKYLGILLTLLLLLAMAIIGMWSSFFVDDTDPALFNPDGNATAPDVQDPAPGPDTTAPGDTGTDTGNSTSGEVAPADTAAEGTTTADTDTAPTPQVLSPDEAEALYAESQIWQRAPETLGEPFTPALELGAVEGPDATREAPAAPAADAAPGLTDAPVAGAERAAPLPPPPADTVFELGANGLVAPSTDGTVSPTGILIFEGAPAVVPPARPTPPAQPEATPEDATLDDATLDDTALEQAVEQAVEAAAALTDDTPAPDLPDVQPEPRPEDVPASPETDAAAPEAIAPDDGAALTTEPAGPTEAVVETVAADPASIEAAVDAVTASFVNATDLAVARSIKPTQRPDDIDQIVQAAMARAAEAPAAAPAAAPATTTPSIPTNASVANQATTPNAIDLREINLLGISGPSNARRALVRMENGRYVTVKVGDRLDGGRVTSITSDGLTYQKGARNYTLQLLPLG